MVSTKFKLRWFLFFVLIASVSHSLEAKKYRYNLAICTIFRDDAPYLKEWIEFHKIVGVEHFYLYNNFSQDHFLHVLQPYINAGEVELIDWPYLDNTFQGFCFTVQPEAYNDCIMRTRGKVHWLAIIDTDEFLTPTENNTSVSTILDMYKEFAGVCFDWQVFGTSNVPSIPENKTLIETLRLKAKRDHPKHQFYKSIVQPKYVKYCDNPHFAHYKYHCFAVNPEKTPMKSKKSAFNRPHLKPLVINHYWTRAEDYCYGSKFPQYARWNETMTLERFKKSVEELSFEQDDSMDRFIPQLRVNMGFTTN